ncbi:MAG: hypothetical protein PVH68_14705 [Armatimonadota bacterium]|jgi:hypothetical protein
MSERCAECGTEIRPGDRTYIGRDGRRQHLRCPGPPLIAGGQGRRGRELRETCREFLVLTGLLFLAAAGLLLVVKLFEWIGG